MDLTDVVSEGPDTHVPAIDDDPAPAGTETTNTEVTETETNQENAETGEGQEKPAEEAAAPDAQKQVQIDLKDPQVQKWINRAGLDPNSPKDLKTLKTLLDQDRYIAELQARPQTAAAANDGLTEFERELLKQEQEPQPQPRDDKGRFQGKQGQDEAKPESQPKGPAYNDIGKDWQGPDDALRSIAEAWAEAGEKQDFRKVNQIEAAIYERRFDAIAMPKIAQFVQYAIEQFAQQHLGDVVPQMRAQTQQAQEEQAFQFAMGELEKAKGFEDIAELTKEQDGPPILINGEKFGNTPLNRIIAEHPEILDIRREHKDRATADRLTFLARLRVAHAFHNSGKIAGAKASDLVKAGERIQKRADQDRIRQQLNSGRGAGGLKKPASFVEELQQDPDAPASFAAL